jgi:acetoacetyl-CoA synthetase
MFVNGASTVASQALGGIKAEATGRTPLVLMKAGTGIPLFLVHGLGGLVSELLPLAQQFASPHPIYGFGASQADLGNLPRSIEELAKLYVGAVRQIQARGPYLIGGYSFGGVIALEMARRLVSLGEPVGLLVFLDSYTHPKSWPLAARLSVLWKRIRNQLSSAAERPVRATSAYYVLGMVNIVRNLRKYGRPLGPFGFRGSSIYSPDVRQIIEICEAMWLRYRPRFYPGRVTFLKASNGVRFPDNPAAIWSSIVRDLNVHVIAGEHLDLMGCNVGRVADRLAQCIKEALGPHSPAESNDCDEGRFRLI